LPSITAGYALKMHVDKAHLIEQFIAAGDLDKAELADQLPDQIDPEAHADELRALGLDPGLLLTQSDNLEDQYRPSDSESD
jgi:hypothetical protein